MITGDNKGGGVKKANFFDYVRFERSIICFSSIIASL